MDVDSRQNLQDDQMSDCRSFGSNFHPSSQSRKISIGILIDSLPVKISGAPKEDEAVAAHTEGVSSNKDGLVEDRNRGGGATDVAEGKQSLVPKQVPAPWITTLSIHQKSPTSEATLHPAETCNLPGTSGRRNKLSRKKNTPVTRSVEFFANRTSDSHSGEEKHKRFNGFTYRRKGRKSRKPEEEFTVRTAQEGPILDKPVKNDITQEKRTETLKMKLWEILENVSSPRSQPSNPHAQIGISNLNQERILDQTDDKFFKPRQSSDTIETDSQSPNTMKRPVTRSLTCKRASKQPTQEKTKAAPSSNCRQKIKENSVFSFNGGLFGKRNVAVNGDASMCARNKVQMKSCSIEPRKLHFNEDNNADEIPKGIHKSEATLAAEKASPPSNKMERSHGSPWNKRLYPEPRNRNKERDSHQSAREESCQSPRIDSHQSLQTHRRDQQKDFRSSTVPENGDQQEDFDTPSKTASDPHDDFQSPTFKINMPTSSSPPSSMPKTDQKQVFRSPDQAMRSYTVGNIHKDRILQTSMADYFASNIQTESPDVAAELIDSPPSKTSRLKGEKDVEGSLSELSLEAGHSEGSEESSPIVGGHRERNNNYSPETAATERSKFMLHPAKRLCNLDGEKVREFSPTPPSPTGIAETGLTPDSSEQNQGDELERVIKLFASALGNFKNKMKSETRKKSSDILLSVSEEINLQLQNIKSQIRTDLGKLSSVSKTKRKRLESRFEEQQEQLKLIHDKLRQDIFQHLQECKITLEGLELHQNDLKGAAKKQKVSHQKLLVQAEAAVETQLNDAQRRITAVHKSAREKMLQLKYVIAECLNEGVLS